jgi:hypothetical protein
MAADECGGADAFVTAKLGEIEARIGATERSARWYRAAHYALAVPQLVLSATIAGTSGVTDLVDPPTARAVAAALGLANLVLQAAISALPLVRRAVALEHERRALARLRDELQLARLHAVTEAEARALAARCASVDDAALGDGGGALRAAAPATC